MMNFFRNNSKYFVIGMLVIFVGTMFTGMAFLGMSYFGDNASQRQQADMSQEMAVMGAVPVDRMKFAEAQQQVLEQIKGQPISPEVAEAVLYSAFAKAMRFSILSYGAKESKLKLTSTELNIGLQNIYVQFDLKDKAALKKQLKANNYPYKEFIANLKVELLSEKFAQSLAAKETVTDRDLQNAFTTVLAQHILIKPRPEDPNYALNRITEIQAEINSGKITFDQAAQKYSEDEAVKAQSGILGWVKMGDTFRTFEEALFALDQGQTSAPIKTPFGVHLIRSLEKKIAPLPQNPEKVDQLRNQLLTQKQSRAIEEYMQGFLVQNPLTILNPVLRAYHAKTEGRFEEAIQAYNEQISGAPELPSPHYLLGQIYQAMGQTAKAEEQWKSAEIKAGINSQLDFPNLHLALGALYKQTGRPAEMNASFEKVIPSAHDNVALLQQARERFSRMNEPQWVALVDQKIQGLTPAQSASKASEAAPQGQQTAPAVAPAAAQQ